MPRSRWRRPGRLLLVFLVLGGAALFVRSRMRPRFPDEGNLGIDIPTLRVPSAACYEDESHRILLMLEDYDDIEMRLTWDPEDGKGRIRVAGPGTEFPEIDSGLITRGVAPSEGTPAIVIAGSIDLDRMPFPGRLFRSGTRYYLGGLDADGNIGAVPFQADPEECEILNRTPTGSMPRDPQGDLVVELRITREGDRVRYRWGPASFLAKVDVDKRFSGGDVTFTADEVARPGTGPLIPGLAKRLARSRPGPRPMWKIVLLEVGTGVRYVDILRAVECAPGDPLVMWHLWSGTGELERVGLPTAPAEGAPVLGESVEIGKRLRLDMDVEGVLLRRGRRVSIEALPALFAEADAGLVLLLRADDRLPFGSVLRIIRAAESAGLPVCLALKPLDPQIPFDTVFKWPSPVTDQPPVAVRLLRKADALEPDRTDFAGQQVRIDLPEDAQLEETLDALIRMRLAGATGFEFE